MANLFDSNLRLEFDLKAQNALVKALRNNIQSSSRVEVRMAITQPATLDWGGTSSGHGNQSKGSKESGGFEIRFRNGPEAIHAAAMIPFLNWQQRAVYIVCISFLYCPDKPPPNRNDSFAHRNIFPPD